MSTWQGAPWGARALLGAAVLLSLAAVVLVAADNPGLPVWVGTVSAVVYLGVGLLGLVLARRDGRNPIAWVLLAGSLGAALLPLAELLASRVDTAGSVVVGIVGAVAGVAVFGLFSLGVLLFPDGRAHGRLGRGLVPAAAVALGAIAVGAMGAALATAPIAWTGPIAGVASGALGAGLLCFVAVAVLAAVSATFRRRAAAGDLRRALRLMEVAAWLNAVTFLACAAVSAVAELPDWFGAVAEQTGMIFAIAAWVGILRFRLVDLRAMLAGVLPYALAAGLVVGVATGVAALAGAVISGWLGTVVGATVAALLALLLRDPLQALGNLVVYGRAVDPATERARRLEDALHASHRMQVTARDDERRRIRRDLHDGLGPTLAGMVLGVESVERHLGDPMRARAELAHLHEVSRGAVQDVRRIIYALRPPALDSLGLDGAIRDQADRLGATEVDIVPLPELPETMEIGVYLIALEAMRNAATHAGGPFRVRLRAAGMLLLEIEDDGVGLPADFTAGVGVLSMRERAASLGGTIDIRAQHPRGTLVRAEWVLP